MLAQAKRGRPVLGGAMINFSVEADGIPYIRRNLPGLARVFDEAEESLSCGALRNVAVTARVFVEHITMEVGKRAEQPRVIEGPDRESLARFIERLAAGGLIPPDVRGICLSVRRAGNNSVHRLAFDQAVAKHLDAVKAVARWFEDTYGAVAPPSDLSLSETEPQIAVPTPEARPIGSAAPPSPAAAADLLTLEQPEPTPDLAATTTPIAALAPANLDSAPPTPPLAKSPGRKDPGTISLPGLIVVALMLVVGIVFLLA